MDARDPKRAWTRDAFEFGSVLGQGALARVYRVRDRLDRREYALKVLEKRAVTQRCKIQEVMREKKLLTELVHPNIVSLYGAFQDHSSLYFLLELGDHDLKDLITRHSRLPVSVAEFYSAELVAALSFLRERYVVHRDLKPDNCLVMPNRHLKLTDFDAACYVDPERGFARCSRDQPGEVESSFVGTALYIAPEVLEGVEGVGFSVDLWALGCILFQMLTGTPPFKACSEYWTFQRILKLDLLFPSDFPLCAKSLVAKLLEPEPTRRIGCKSMAELRRDAYFAGVDFASLPSRSPPELLASPLRDRFLGAEGAMTGTQRSWSASDLECTPNTGTEFLCTDRIDILYSGDDDPADRSTERATEERRGSSEEARQGPGPLVLKATDIGVRSRRRSAPTPCTLVLTDQPGLYFREREGAAPLEGLSGDQLAVVDVASGPSAGTFVVHTSRGTGRQTYVCETDGGEAESWVLHIRHYFLVGQHLHGEYTRRRCSFVRKCCIQ